MHETVRLTFVVLDKQEFTDDDVIKAQAPLNKNHLCHILSHFTPADAGMTMSVVRSDFVVPFDVTENFNDEAERGDIQIFKEGDDLADLFVTQAPLSKLV